jgi:cobalt-zinc-cadmium efflux system protein
MLFAPSHIKINEVVTEILIVKGIKNIHHIHIWQLNDHECHFEAHLEFNEDIKLSEFDFICEEVEKLLLEKFQIQHSNLQPEYRRDDLKEIIIQD